MQIDFLIFRRPPQPFNKHVVPPGAPPVHADLNAAFQKQPGERGTGELATLIGIKNAGRAVFCNRVRNRFKIESKPSVSTAAAIDLPADCLRLA
jgi:hypothetical protein